MQVGIVVTVSVSLPIDITAFATGSYLPIASGLAVIPIDPGAHPIHRTLVLAVGAKIRPCRTIRLALSLRGLRRAQRRFLLILSKRGMQAE